MSAAQRPPPHLGDATRHRVVIGALVVLAACLAVLVVVLGAGLVSGAAKAVCLLAACIVVGLIVVLLPVRLRTRAATFAAAFVAAAGVLPVFLSSDDSPAPPKPPAPRAHPQYLAELVRRGPFTELLPAPLRPVAIKNIEDGDPSAATRLDAVQLEIDTSGESGLYAFALIEIYPDPAAAEKRKAARIALFKRNYGANNVYDGCVDDYGAHGAGWTCVDSRGFAYVEAAISPSDNSHTPLATGTLAALLRYTDRLTKVAT
jgi:hypothetical protein